MAPSPTIPTSFVPKQPVKTVARRSQSGTNIFTLFGFALLVLSVFAAAGVFGYQKYLEGVRDADAQKLEDAKSQINRTTVEDFIRTRDRFVAAHDILNNHIAFSQYLDKLESITLQTVRFTNLRYTLGPDGNAMIQMSGSARSFNALAAESNVFTGVKEFNRAIFSGIGLNEKENTVTFIFSATLDKNLLLTDPLTVTPAADSLLPASGTTTVQTLPSGTSTPPATGTPVPPVPKPATTTP